MNKEKVADCVVERVVARSVMVPLEYPVKTSVGTVAASPLVLIDLHLGNGIVGHSYVFTYTPLALESTRVLANSLGMVLCGQALAPFEFDRLLGTSNNPRFSMNPAAQR